MNARQGHFSLHLWDDLRPWLPKYFLPNLKKNHIMVSDEVLVRYAPWFPIFPVFLSTPLLGCPGHGLSSPGCRPWLFGGCILLSQDITLLGNLTTDLLKHSLPNHFPHFTSSATVGKGPAKALVLPLFVPLPLSSCLGWPEGRLAVQDPDCAEATPKSLWTQGVFLCPNWDCPRM